MDFFVQNDEISILQVYGEQATAQYMKLIKKQVVSSQMPYFEIIFFSNLCCRNTVPRPVSKWHKDRTNKKINKKSPGGYTYLCTFHTSQYVQTYPRFELTCMHILNILNVFLFNCKSFWCIGKTVIFLYECTVYRSYLKA